jgi:S1-C subfamily serine protease
MTVTFRAWHLALATFLAGIAIAAAFFLLSADSTTPEESQAAKSTEVLTRESSPETATRPLPTPVNTAIAACDRRTSAERVRPSVVRIQAARSVGTGIVVDAAGLVLTNEHVVRLSRVVSVTFSNGSVLTGTVLARSAEKDLAIVRGPATGLQTAIWGDERALRPAATLLAWGYTLDLPGEPSITTASSPD